MPSNRCNPIVLGTSAFIGLFLYHPLTIAESLGTIHVESSTIGDRFEDKRIEPSAMAVIDGKEVDKAHVENIQQLLQSIPGITTEVQSGDSLKIHIRGVENQVYMGEKPGVAVVIDGVPVFERTGRVNIDLDNIESIRVIKGGASYLFGDDALSGAVIITTKKGAGQAGYKIATEAGSFGHNKTMARAGYAGDDSNGHIQISQRATDGYYDDSGSSADYINGKWQYYLNEKSDLQLGFELADRAKNSHGSVRGVTAAENDPTSENTTDYNDYANRYSVGLEKLFLTYNQDMDAGGNLMVNTYSFGDNTKFFTAPADSDPNLYTYDNDYAQVQQGLKAEYRKDGETLAWMLGTDLRDNSYDNYVTYNRAFTDYAGPHAIGDISSDNRTIEQVSALYGEAKYRPADKWLLTLNGRSDQINLDYTDNTDSSNNSKSFDIFSSRIGTNYAASDKVDYYANVSTGFRAPSVTQLFVGSNSPTHKTAANPDLTPETTDNIELGMRRKTSMFGSPLELDLALFQLDRKDHIQASGGQYSTSADSVYDNIGDMRSQGLELSMFSEINKRWSWNLAYTNLNAFYTRYENFNLQLEPIAGVCPAGATEVTQGPTVINCLMPYNNTGNVVPRTPDHHINLSVSMRPSSTWTITGEMDAISSYYADEINQLEIDGHQTFNLLVNYERKSAGIKWSAFGRIDNLLDTHYYNTARASGDGNDDGVYDAEDLSITVNQGRTFTLGVSAEF